MGVDAIVTLLSITSVLLLAVGLAVYFAQPKDRANIMFALFNIGLCLWTLTIIGFRSAQTFDSGMLWMKAAYAVAFLCGVSFWFFSKTLEGTAEYHRSSVILHSALVIIYSAIIFSTNLLVRSWHYLPDGSKAVTVGVFGWWMYAVYFSSYFLVGNLVLLRLYRKSSTDLKRQLRWLIGGVFLGGQVFGVFFNLILPSPIFNEWHYIWSGPFLTALFIAPLITYGIIRHKLLNAKIIAAQMLVIAMVLLAVINLLGAKDVSDVIYGSLSLAGLLIFGILLIRSVYDEVRRREEIQRLALQLQATNKRLRQLDDLKTTMVGIASHQIRGPLGGIRGYMSLFRDGDLGPLTPKQKEVVAMNMNVLTRLINAVEMFLDITRLESGKIMIKKEKAPLDEVVGAMVKEFEIPMQKKGLVLDFSVDGDRPIEADIDPEKTKHVVFNLIDNAMKYTARGSVSIRVRSDGHNALCEVRDTGIGVTPEDLPRLFGKFERGELVVDRGGSGLGLYIVKMLTEMQGGKVWVSSPGAGKGSVFTVSFPLAR